MNMKKLSWIHYTEIFILVVTLVVLGYDGYIYLVHGNAATESATIFRWSVHVPPLAFLSGIIAGHFFFQMHEPSEFPNDADGNIVYQVGPYPLVAGEFLVVNSDGLFVPRIEKP